MNLTFLEKSSYGAFFANTIRDYINKHQGQYPTLIKLHPVLMQEFKAELAAGHYIQLDGIWHFQFYGVRFTEDIKAKYPIMIGYNNEIVYI